MWWAWLACRATPEPLPAETGHVPPVAPHIVDSWASCDVESSSWDVHVESDTFSGGARAFFTVDGSYVENHGVPVISSHEDGSGDLLESTYPIVGDWRLANPAKTAFSCADAPSVAFLLWDTDAVPQDCAIDGDPAVFESVNATAICRAGRRGR